MICCSSPTNIYCHLSPTASLGKDWNAAASFQASMCLAVSLPSRLAAQALHLLIKKGIEQLTDNTILPPRIVLLVHVAG
jgi:hypothetical protein